MSFIVKKFLIVAKMVSTVYEMETCCAVARQVSRHAFALRLVFTSDGVGVRSAECLVWG